MADLDTYDEGMIGDKVFDDIYLNWRRKIDYGSTSQFDINVRWNMELAVRADEVGRSDVARHHRNWAEYWGTYPTDETTPDETAETDDDS